MLEFSKNVQFGLLLKFKIVAPAGKMMCMLLLLDVQVKGY